VDGDEIAQRLECMCEASGLPRATENVQISTDISGGQQCDVCGEQIERHAVAMIVRARGDKSSASGVFTGGAS
jgi:hypothetical protein